MIIQNLDTDKHIYYNYSQKLLQEDLVTAVIYSSTDLENILY